MEKTDDIRLLIERFLNAETTLAEEDRLYRYFAGAEVAPELEEYREMFLGLKALALPPEQQMQVQAAAEPDEVPMAPHANRLRLVMRYAAAAVVALVIGVAISHRQEEGNYCIAYIGGRTTTDEDIVMNEMTTVMHGLMTYEGTQDVDHQLKEIFNR
jgi:hypothetical protein